MIRRYRKQCVIFLFCLLFTGCAGTKKEPGRYYDKGYSIKFPQEWQKTQTAPGARTAMLNKSGKVSVNILVQKVNAKVTLDQVIAYTQERSKAGGLTITNSQAYMIAGIKGHLTIKNMTAAGQSFIIKEFTVLKNKTVYTLLFTIDRNHQLIDQQEADQVVQSFRLE